MEESQNPNQETGIRISILSPSQVAQKLKQNLTSRSEWAAELNGAMGDLGTYIPVILALTLAKNLDLGTTLIFTGIYNFATGAIYGVPMPVQPMKSIAAVAISTPDFNIPEVMAAGICTGGVLLILGLTGLMHIVCKLIPLPVVRGIQLAQGLSFAMTGVKYIREVQALPKSKAGAGERPWLGLDGLLLALTCACFIIIVNGSGEKIENREIIDHGVENLDTRASRMRKLRKIFASLPSAFLIFLLGLVLAVVRGGTNAVRGFELGPSPVKIVKISKHEWREGFIKGTIPQLPLSILNSVIAVCKLSLDLFPDKNVPATSVSATVGLMNVVGCWFGAMPCCHGAGGLAGQYRFGGRTGACVAVLGVGKLVLGLVLGSSSAGVLSRFPVGVLGVLLLFAGMELAACCRDMGCKEECFVMLVCSVVSLVGSSAALGFLCGMVVHLLVRLRKAESWSTFFVSLEQL
ncbi:TATA-binding protein-associated factor mot1 [Orobanche gracilis]